MKDTYHVKGLTSSKYNLIVDTGRKTYLNRIIKPLNDYICDAYENILKHYLNKYSNLDHMVGFEGEMIDPNIISDDQLTIFYDFCMYHDYELITTLNNWDHDLFGVFCGIKPLALIDNDCLLDDFNEDYSHLDFKLRHLCSIYGIEKIAFNLRDDPTNLYYWPQNWKNAAVLYKCHTGKIKIPFTTNYFDMFQAVLLGYSLTSTILYLNSNSFSVFIADGKSEDGYDVGHMEKKYDTFEKKKNHYQKFYNRIMKTVKELEPLWNEVNDFIRLEKDKLTNDDKLFFRGM